jgi:uncharacterized protein
VFAAIVFHATSNLSQFLFPNYGSHYDPLIPGLIVTLAAVIVTLVWGPETLARCDQALPTGQTLRCPECGRDSREEMP